MSHHGKDSKPSPELEQALKALFNSAPVDIAKVNPLKGLQRQLQGEFQDGRLNENDEGALAVAVGVENGQVVIRFPHTVTWVGFSPAQALEIAQILITNARKAGLVAPSA